MFTEYDIAREIQKFQFKTWEFRATSYSVNSQASVSAHINKQEVGMIQKIFSSPTNRWWKYFPYLPVAPYPPLAYQVQGGMTNNYWF